MRRLKFAVQVTVLVLAFPLWFYAEMKHTDKTLKKNDVERVDSINNKKAETTKEKEVDVPDLPDTGMQKLMVVSY